MQPSIYLIINKVNNKLYVGSTINPVKRWSTHKWNCSHNQYPNLAIYRAMNKYGVENFSFEVIEAFDSVEPMTEAEIWWISYFKMLGAELYNMTPGGDGCTSIPEESKKIISRKKRQRDSESHFSFENDFGDLE